MRRYHEQVFARYPDAKIALRVLHKTESLSPPRHSHNLAAYSYFAHCQSFFLLSRYFVVWEAQQLLIGDLSLTG